VLTITELTFRYGGRMILERASAQLSAGHKVGVIGRNGAGKSTLFKLILGEIGSEGGSIALPRGVRIGTVAQEAPDGPTPPLDFVLAADTVRTSLLATAESSEDVAELEEAHARLAALSAGSAPARAAAILNGLGFDEAAQHRPLSSFSGGWKMRVALAATLFAQPDLLLLDEPSNHLDIEAALWLEEHLRRWPGTILLISHDRALLNAACDQMLHVDGGKLTLYRGDYDNFERQRRERLMQQAALHTRQQAERKEIQAFVDRFRAKASKARQAQSRMKRLEKMEPIAAVIEDPGVQIKFPTPAELPPPLITLDGVSVGYEPGRPILSNLNLRIDPEDRIALLGPNGNGKSTLTRLLANRLAAERGKVVRARKLGIGYFAQSQGEELNMDASAFTQLQHLMPNATPVSIRSRLGSVGFSGPRADMPVGKLSGGERARLLLALMLHDAPALLLLDEPTNHLDIDARAALVEAINSFPGAVVMVSHDRSLLDLTADQLWLVADGTVQPFEGDLDDYAQRITPDEKAARAEAVGGTAQSRKEERRAAATKRNQLAPLRKIVHAVEQKQARLSSELMQVEAQLADPALYTGPQDRMTELLRRKGDISAKIAAIEAEWEAAQTALDEAEATVDAD
jgi:ATP-binding cassette subfamily F protein 3